MFYVHTKMDRLPSNGGLDLAEIEAALKRARRILETMPNETDRNVLERYIAELESERSRLSPR